MPWATQRRACVCIPAEVVHEQDIDDLVSFIDERDGNVVILTANPRMELDLVRAGVDEAAFRNAQVLR